LIPVTLADPALTGPSLDIFKSGISIAHRELIAESQLHQRLLIADHRRWNIWLSLSSSLMLRSLPSLAFLHGLPACMT